MALAQNPATTIDEAQKLVNNEIDNLSDGPGGEFLALTTKAHRPHRGAGQSHQPARAT